MSAVQKYEFNKNLVVHTIITETTHKCFFNADDIAACLHIKDVAITLHSIDASYKDMWFSIVPKLNNPNAPSYWTPYTVFLNFAGVYQMSTHSTKLGKDIFVSWIFDFVMTDLMDTINQNIIRIEYQRNSDLLDSMEQKIAQLRLRLFEQIPLKE